MITEPESPTDPNLGPPDQRLALYVLNNKNVNGVTLVPEHVETRSLKNPLQPSMDQVTHWIVHYFRFFCQCLLSNEKRLLHEIQLKGFIFIEAFRYINIINVTYTRGNPYVMLSRIQL